MEQMAIIKRSNLKIKNKKDEERTTTRELEETETIR